MRKVKCGNMDQVPNCFSDISALADKILTFFVLLYDEPNFSMSDGEG